MAAYFKYTNNGIMGSPNHAFQLEINDLYSEESVMEIYSTGLNFPSYFGGNWDALSDCLRDLSWIEKKEIQIVHKELRNLRDHDFRIYIEILYDVCECWEKYPNEHIIEIYFSPTDQVRIETIIDAYKWKRKKE